MLTRLMPFAFAALRIQNVDGAGDAVNVTANDLTVAHQLDVNSPTRIGATVVSSK